MFCISCIILRRRDTEDIYTVEDKIPLYDLEIQVNTDGKQVKEVRSVPDETPLSFVQEGKYVKFFGKKSRRTSDDLYSILKEGDVLEILYRDTGFQTSLFYRRFKVEAKNWKTEKETIIVVCC